MSCYFGFGIFICFLFFYYSNWQINFFTAEAGLFVRNLKYFSNIENICINRQLEELLRTAYFTIEMLLKKAEVIETPNLDLINLINEFDERHYCLRRFLECRSCCVSI